jgi:CBS domain containing-hemolysin-like protein
VIASLIVLVLILLNGLFVAAEFALIGASRPALEALAQQGSHRAKAILAILRDPRATDRYIATAQLGITFASQGLGMYGEHQLAEWLTVKLRGTALDGPLPVHTLASGLALSALTYLHIVLGEMIPKTLALQKAEAMVLVIAAPMRWMLALMLPLVVLLNGVGAGVLRLFGVRASEGHGEAPSPQDLAFLVDESVEGGRLGELPGRVFDELLAFGELTAAEVMTPRVKLVGIRRGSSNRELREVLSRANHTRYPVYERDLDDLLGFVHIRDLLDLLVREEPFNDRLIRPVPFVPETARLDAVLNRMRSEKTHIAVVMDEHGGTEGIVTIEDLFEEVVGEIADHPGSPPPLRRVEGLLRSSGQTRVEEIGEELRIEGFLHPEVDTVSGLVLALLGRPPLVGDVVTWQGVRFRVLDVEGHGVEECEVYPPVPEAPAATDDAPAP